MSAAEPPEPPGPPTAERALAACLDSTLLRPEATAEEIDRLCDEAAELGCGAVCVHGRRVARAARRLAGAGPRVAAVVGFPHGASRTEVKVLEARLALEDGALELDLVIALWALADGDDARVREDLAAVVEVAAARGARVKAILECGLWDEARIVRAARAAVDAGAAFVKTSTGFAGTGARVEDVRLLRRSVPDAVGIKAAGGIRTLEDARAMLAAGATRLGTSAARGILEQARGGA